MIRGERIADHNNIDTIDEQQQQQQGKAAPPPERPFSGGGPPPPPRPRHPTHHDYPPRHSTDHEPHDLHQQQRSSRMHLDLPDSHPLGTQQQQHQRSLPRPHSPLDYQQQQQHHHHRNGREQRQAHLEGPPPFYSPRRHSHQSHPQEQLDPSPLHHSQQPHQQYEHPYRPPHRSQFHPSTDSAPYGHHRHPDAAMATSSSSTSAYPSSSPSLSSHTQRHSRARPSSPSRPPHLQPPPTLDLSRDARGLLRRPDTGTPTTTRGRGPRSAASDGMDQRRTSTPKTGGSSTTISWSDPGSIRYELEVVQQPERARMCGFGGRDRRVVDPPPIIRLVARHAITHAVVPSTTEHPLLILHASLYTLSGHPANIISKTLNPTPQSSSSSQLNPPHGNLSDATYLNTLTGSLVSSAFSLVGLDGLQGVFFVFGDLSVRVEGAYKLGFRLCSVASGGQPPNHPLISTDITTITAETFSEPFTVYTAKEFPGMLESTNLTKSFARQGVRLPVRGKKRRGMRTKTVVAPTTTTTAATAAAVEEEEGQEDEEEEEEGDGSPAPIVNSKASSSTSRKTTMRAKKFPVQQPKLTSSSVPPPPPPTTTTTTTSSATPAGPRPSASPSATEPPTPKNPPRRRHRPPPVEKLPVEDDTHSSSTAHSSTLSDH